MVFRHHAIRVSRENRVALDGLSVTAYPRFPNSGHQKKGVVLQTEKVWKIGPFVFFPLVESVRGNEAASPFECRFEGRFFRDRFTAGVDDGGLRLWLF